MNLITEDFKLIEQIKADDKDYFNGLYNSSKLEFSSIESYKEAYSNFLAYWTAKDGEQMKRIIVNSKPYKTFNDVDDIDDYISRAISSCKKVNKNKPRPVKSKYKAISFEDIEAKDVEWIWFPWIPKGCITVIASEPGTGKTYLSLNLAAVLSSGGYIDNPNSIFYGLDFKEYKIIYQSAEDSPSMLKNRLEGFKEKPNYKNIIMMSEDEKSTNYKDKELENFIIEHKPDIIIFDTLQAFLPPNTKGNDQASMREALNPLFYLCEKYDMTVILLAHTNKNTGAKAINRVTGSIDTVAAARNVLALARDRESSLINLCAVKTNVADIRKIKTIQFHIDPKAGGIVFDGYSNLSADEIMNDFEVRRAAPKKDKAKDFLYELLEDGPMLKETIVQKAEAEGISNRTLEEAKKELNIKSKRYEYQGHYYWGWPEDLENFVVPIQEEVKFSIDNK
ncbi:AAA family ATPase [Neofamilia massiliensis]|uniref:AAA family ATPase n=1 Tax=Neofamilia massiliensis TaxID=1673724 RepID=UPI0006BB727B|nr:AAA family ATPase [Neofamilia massiliensis]